MFQDDPLLGDGGFRSLGECLRDFLDDLVATREGRPLARTVPTGLTDLDLVLCGGLRKGAVSIVASRPRLGKSSLAFNIATNVAIRYGAAVAILTRELSPEQVAARILSSESGLETARLRSGNLTDSESRKLGHALGIVSEARIYPCFVDEVTVDYVCDLVRQINSEVGLDAIIIDDERLFCLEEMSKSRTDALAEVSRRLKMLARELDVSILITCQLSAPLGTARPRIPDMSALTRETAIDEFASTVMLLHREDYYDRQSEKQGIADVYIARHSDGPTGQISLLFNQRTARFLDLGVTFDEKAV